MLSKTLVRDQSQGGIPRQIAPNDLVACSLNTSNTLTTAGAGSLTAALLTKHLLIRSGPGGAVDDTTVTAAAIIAALGASNGSCNAGDAWVLRYVNTVAQVITIVGGTGVTVTNETVNASSVKDFLITVTNATTQSVVGGVGTTSGNKILTGFTEAQLALITPGMSVTGTGIGASALVVGVGNGQVTVDVNSTATAAAGAATGVVVTFSPRVAIYGIGQGLL